MEQSCRVSTFQKFRNFRISEFWGFPEFSGNMKKFYNPPFLPPYNLKWANTLISGFYHMERGSYTMYAFKVQFQKFRKIPDQCIVWLTLVPAFAPFQSLSNTHCIAFSWNIAQIPKTQQSISSTCILGKSSVLRQIHSLLVREGLKKTRQIIHILWINLKFG